MQCPFAGQRQLQATAYADQILAEGGLPSISVRMLSLSQESHLRCVHALLVPHEFRNEFHITILLDSYFLKLETCTLHLAWHGMAWHGMANVCSSSCLTLGPIEMILHSAARLP